MTPAPGGGPASTRTSFAYSFPFLPAPRRRALAAVYAFCRATDDIVDQEGGREEKRARLRRWEAELDLAFAGGSSEAVLNDLAAISRIHGTPRALYHDLIRGVGMDLDSARYPDFDRLREYCHLVASTVGLMCLDIFGRRNARTEEYARTLGIALQLTNIIRDVAADARMDRIYIPIADLETFGCTEGEILSGRDSDRFRRLMAFQASRAEEYYRKAASTLERSDLPAMRPARIMEGIYRRTLRKIRNSGFDVLGGPIRISRPAQFAVAFRYGVLGKYFPG